MSLGVGIDVGAATVTVAGVRRHRGGLALELLRHYPLEELCDEAEPTPARVASAVARRLREAGLRPRGVVLGVSGRDAIIRYSQLPPMPDWRLKLLMQLEIEDVSERTGEPLSADWRAIPDPSGGNMVLVALAKDARVQEAVEAFEAVGVEVGGAVPQPVATADCYRFLGEDAADGLTLVLDIGDRSTEVALVEDGELVFARSVALGGAAFTERLQKALGVSAADAEQLKRSGQLPGGASAEEALAAPRAQLVSMVEASVQFARGQLQRKALKVDRVAVAGGSARVPGLIEALGRALGCPAEPFDAPAQLELRGADRATREGAEAHGLEAATAIGLALSAVLPAAFRLDLLPLAVKRRLEFRHRTVWLYGSAGVLAAALLVAFALVGWRWRGEAARREQLHSALAALDRRLAAHEERKQANDQREADLRALAERARAGHHLAALLRALGELTPAEVSFAEARLVRDEAGGLAFELVGTADDAQGGAVPAMRALERALAERPLVRAARVLPLGDQGSAKEFKLTVVPTGGATGAAGDGS